MGADDQDRIGGLDRGGTVVVFPEGGINNSEVLGGAAYLALKTKAPLLPLHVAGTKEALPPGARLPSLRPVNVFVGSPPRLSCPSGTHADFKRAVAKGKKSFERVMKDTCSLCGVKNGAR